MKGSVSEWLDGDAWADIEQMRQPQPMPPAEIADNGKRLKAATDEIAKLEERWLEVSSELEALTA